jgi:manganese-dependent inorganic pyrophosphatase
MNSKEKIYIVGHRRPDLDSVASALGYQVYMNSIGNFNYYAIVCDKVNSLAEWVFEEFETRLPQYIPDISGMNTVLVDHTYSQSRPKGWEKAHIVGVIDHHDVRLEDIIPQTILIRPCGATSTLITQMMIDSNITIPENISSILLAAIIDDTLNFRSPTTTELDIQMGKQLLAMSNISDIDKFAEKIFLKKDEWKNMDAEEIILRDIKYEEIEGNRVAISQVESLDISKIDEKQIIDTLKSMESLPLHLVMLTDLSKGDCKLLVVGKDIEKLEKVLGKKIKENSIYLENVVSRKKQILPMLEEMYKKE